MEPFGPENMKPVFIAKGVSNTGYSKIVKEQHIRFVLKQDGITLSGIGFKMADKFALLQMNQPLDIVFTLDENEWNNENQSNNSTNKSMKPFPEINKFIIVQCKIIVNIDFLVLRKFLVFFKCFIPSLVGCWWKSIRHQMPIGHRESGVSKPSDTTHHHHNKQ
jgi:hypothetical protein